MKQHWDNITDKVFFFNSQGHSCPIDIFMSHAPEPKRIRDYDFVKYKQSAYKQRLSSLFISHLELKNGLKFDYRESFTQPKVLFQKFISSVNRIHRKLNILLSNFRRRTLWITVNTWVNRKCTGEVWKKKKNGSQTKLQRRLRWRWGYFAEIQGRCHRDTCSNSVWGDR